MTQKTRLLEYLLKHKKITPIVAWKELGIYRLSDTIWQLRKNQLNIETCNVTVYNKFNEPCCVAEYVLHD